MLIRTRYVPGLFIVAGIAAGGFYAVGRIREDRPATRIEQGIATKADKPCLKSVTTEWEVPSDDPDLKELDFTSRPLVVGKVAVNTPHTKRIAIKDLGLSTSFTDAGYREDAAHATGARQDGARTILTVEVSDECYVPYGKAPLAIAVGKPLEVHVENHDNPRSGQSYEMAARVIQDGVTLYERPSTTNTMVLILGAGSLVLGLALWAYLKRFRVM